VEPNKKKLSEDKTDAQCYSPKSYLYSVTNVIAVHITCFADVPLVHQYGIFIDHLVNNTEGGRK